MLMRSCQLQEIKSAELIWNETPAKPSILDSVSITWCTSDYKDLMYKSVVDDLFLHCRNVIKFLEDLMCSTLSDVMRKFILLF